MVWVKHPAAALRPDVTLQPQFCVLKNQFLDSLSLKFTEYNMQCLTFMSVYNCVQCATWYSPWQFLTKNSFDCLSMCKVFVLLNAAWEMLQLYQLAVLSLSSLVVILLHMINWTLLGKQRNAECFCEWGERCCHLNWAQCTSSSNVIHVSLQKLLNPSHERPITMHDSVGNNYFN